MDDGLLFKPIAGRACPERALSERRGKLPSK
jgi:hypothetical protein